jgi:hypothetical protein
MIRYLTIEKSDEEKEYIFANVHREKTGRLRYNLQAESLYDSNIEEVSEL